MDLAIFQEDNYVALFDISTVQNGLVLLKHVKDN